MDNKPITEQYLIDNGFHKWGRDDIPATLSYDKGILKLQPIKAHRQEGEGYGAIWVKDEPNNVLSWRPLIVLRYEKDVETIIKALKLVQDGQ